MFISRKKMAEIEEKLLLQELEIRSLKIDVKQLACDHSNYEYVVSINPFALHFIQSQEKDFAILCKDCGKCLGGATREERALAELEAAKARYQGVQESDQ